MKSMDARSGDVRRLSWPDAAVRGVVAVAAAALVMSGPAACGDSPSSPLKRGQVATVATTPPPDGVTDLRVASVSETSLTLRWTQVDDGAGAPSNYALRFGPAPLTWSLAGASEVTVSGSAIGQSREYTLSGLQEDTQYEVRLVAYRGTLGGDAVQGPLSNGANGRTLASPVQEVSVARVSGHDQSGSAGAALPDPLVVEARADGAPVPDVTVTWSVEGGGSLSAASTTTGADGRARVSWTLGRGVGSQVARAVLASGGDVVTFAATAKPGPVASVLVAPSPVTMAPGGSQTFSATAKDAYGNVVGGASFQWSSSNPAVAAVDASGRATGKDAGSALVRASASGEIGSASLTVTDAPAVDPAQVTDLRVVGASETSLTLRWTQVDDGTGASANYALRFGPPPLTWSLAGASEVTVSGSAIGQSREYTLSGLQEDTQYEVRLVAYRGTLGGDAVQGPLSNGASGRTLALPVQEVSVVRVSGHDQSGSAGAALPDPLVVEARADGAPVPDVTVTWSVEGGGSLSAASTTTGADGRARVSWTLGRGAGSQVARAVLASGGDVVTFAATAKPGPVASVLVVPSPVTMAPGGSQAFSATAKDAYGNVVGGASFQWSSSNPAVAAVDASGRATGKATGSALVRASASGESGSASLIVTDAPAVDPAQVTDLRVASASETSLTLRWTQVDDGTGAPANYALRRGSPTIAWGSAYATEIAIEGTAVGAAMEYVYLGLRPATSQEFRLVSYRGTLGSNAVFGRLSNVAAGSTLDAAPVVARVEATPSSHVFAGPGETLQLSARASDAGGATVADVTFTWTSTNPSVATVDAMGKVTARGVGAAAVIVSVACCSPYDEVQLTVNPEVEGEEPDPTASLVWSDGFESGVLAEQNGYGWRPPTNVTVVEAPDYAHSGTHSLMFKFPGKASRADEADAFSEQRFYFGESLSEVWMEYWLYVDPSYFHRQPDGAANNKFFFLWDSGKYPGGGAGSLAVMLSMERAAGGDSDLIMMWSDEKNMMIVAGSPAWPGAIDDAARGQWSQVRIHAKAGSAGSSGEFDLWWDGVKRIEASPALYDPQDNAFRNGYLMGWANSGFDTDTYFFIDDLKVYKTDPGW